MAVLKEFCQRRVVTNGFLSLYLYTYYNRMFRQKLIFFGLLYKISIQYV